MAGGRSYADALAEAQRLGYAEADPTDDVGGIDAAAKTAILATVAFGSRIPLEWVEVEGIEGVTEQHVTAARALDMHIKLLGRATLADGRVDVRVGPAFVDAHHPLAAVEGAFNAVMLQGDAIREITLEGPGAGGIETASAVVADMVSVVGTTGTGFLQNDPVWRELERMAPGDLSSNWYLRLEVEDRAGVLARIAHELAANRFRWRDWCSSRARTAPCSTSSPTRRGPEASPPRSRRSGRCPNHAVMRARSRSCRIGESKSSGGRRSEGLTVALIDRYPRPAPGERRDARHLARRGLDAVAARATARRGARGARAVAQVGGIEPDRLLQGPRDDRRRLEGGRGRRRGDHLRLDRQHLGLRGRLCRSGGDSGGRPLPRRCGRRPEGRAEPHVRRGDARGAWKLRRGAGGRARAGSTGTHALVNSVNPHRREGQKTAVFEIVEELGFTPGRLRRALRRRREHVRLSPGAHGVRASRRRSSRSRRRTGSTRSRPRSGSASPRTPRRCARAGRRSSP